MATETIFLIVTRYQLRNTYVNGTLLVSTYLSLQKLTPIKGFPKCLSIVSNLQNGPKIFMRASCGPNNLVRAAGRAAGRVNLKLRAACYSDLPHIIHAGYKNIICSSQRSSYNQHPLYVYFNYFNHSVGADTLVNGKFTKRGQRRSMCHLWHLSTAMHKL